MGFQKYFDHSEGAGGYENSVLLSDKMQSKAPQLWPNLGAHLETQIPDPTEVDEDLHFNKSSGNSHAWASVRGTAAVHPNGIHRSILISSIHLVLFITT